MITITPKLKERFCKDYNISIKIFEEPYFLERLKLYDKQYNTIEKWSIFIKEIQKYESEQQYFEDYNRIKDEAINFIKNTKKYKEFNDLDMNQYKLIHNNLPSKDIYHPDNVGKLFISIDMKKANFSSLHKYSASIFGNKHTWEEFLSMFTNNQYIIQSKYIRQVILGNCNPKRHITYEKHIMDNILSQLETIIPINNCVFFSNDEIIFQLPSSGISEEYYNIIKEIKKKIELFPDLHDIQVPVRMELFRLQKIYNTDGYIKNIFDDSFKSIKLELKCMNHNTLPFVLRSLNEESIEKNDAVFMHENMLAQFIDFPEVIIPFLESRLTLPPNIENKKEEKNESEDFDCDFLF